MNHIAVRANNTDPALAAANASQTTLTAKTNLAEDTIIGSAMDIKPGKAKSAMFANPVNGGKEEMLYIDDNNALRWIKHSNGYVTSAGVQVNPAWVNDTVAADYASVVVAVHTMGDVWAFAISASKRNVIDSFRLVPDTNSDAGAVWEKSLVEVFPNSMNPNVFDNLSVQYLTDRPATPLVFVTTSDGVNATVLCANAVIPTAPRANSWFLHKRMMFNLEELAGFGGVSKWKVDGPYHAYTLIKGQITLLYGNDQFVNRNVCQGSSYTSIAGVCSSQNGPSCVAFSRTATVDMGLVFIHPTGYTPQFAGTLADTVPIDQPLDDVVVWQDAGTLMHVYGRAADGGLHVVHQKQWLRSESTSPSTHSQYVPLWDTHVRVADGPAIATTRALLANVASYNIDPFPDAFPDQHVMHSGVSPGEMCAFYRQNVEGTYCAKEQVRIVPEILPAPYKVKRYQTVVTAKTGFGTPAANLKLTLTSAASIDLQVNGMFYRPGPNTPIHLVTNYVGEVILRVMAEGLHQPSLQISAAGVSGDLSVNPTAGVQKFLSGVGGLPNHPDGFTPEFVENAKNPNGSDLFPGIDREDRKAGGKRKANQWPPTADELVDFCKSVFAIQADTDITVDDPAKSGAKVKALGISFQMHDKTRAGYEVHVSSATVQMHRDRLVAFSYGNGIGDFFADLTQGIRSGLVEVQEVFIDINNKVVQTLVKLADGMQAIYQHALEFVHEAAQAVESVVAAVGAKIQDVINYLSWLFEFKDVWDTKTAMESALSQVFPIFETVFKQFQGTIDEFIDEQIKNIDTTFETLKRELGQQTLGSAQATPQPTSSQGPAISNTTQNTVNSGHAKWLTEHVSLAVASAGSEWLERHPLRSTNGDDPFIKFLEKILASPGWSNMYAILLETGKLLTEAFSGDDPNTVASTALITLFDIFKELALAALNFAKTFIDDLLELLHGFLTNFSEYADELVDLSLLSTLYKFIQAEAGVSPDKFEELTFGRLGILMFSFITTLVMKVVTGNAPYPGGVFPDLFSNISDKDYIRGSFAEGPIEPPAWSYRNAAAEMFGLYELFTAGKDAMGDATSIMSYGNLVFRIFGRIFVVLDIVGTVVNCPTIYGVSIGTDNKRANMIWSAWFFGLLANGLDAATTFYLGYMSDWSNTKKDKYGQVAMVVGWFLDLGQFTFRLERYEVAPNHGTVDGQLILAENMIESVQALVSPTRVVIADADNPEVKVVLYAIKTGLSVVTHTSSFILRNVRIRKRTNPVITGIPAHLPDGSVGATYPTVNFGAEGSSPPFTWSAVSAPHGSAGEPILPPGITINSAGVLGGVPTQAGTYGFAIRVMDTYVGPAWGYQTKFFKVKIT